MLGMRWPLGAATQLWGRPFMQEPRGEPAVAATSSGSELPLYATAALMTYTSAAGITTVYSMLSMFYREFNDPLHLGWVVTSYWLVASVCAALCGRLGDVLGRRRMSMTVLTIAGIGALVSARAHGLAGVVLGCALQGAAGTLTPLAIGILREALPKQKLPLAIGIVTAAGTTGAGVSFMVAGFFIDHFSWRGGFYMKATLALLTMIALLAVVRPQAARSGALSKSGASGLLFAPAIAGIFVCLQYAKSLGWHNGLVWGGIVACLALLLFWGFQQSRQPNPLIDVRSLLQRPVLLANLSIAFLAMGFMQNGQVMSLLFQQPAWTGIGFSLSATLAGALLLPLNSISLIGGPTAGSLTRRLGARPVALTGCTLIIAASSAIALFHRTLPFVIVADLAGLFGLSLVQTSSYITVVQSTPAERTSEATGMTYVFLNTFIAIGGQIIFLLFANQTVSRPALGAGTYPSEAGYGFAFTFLIVTALAGLIVAWLLPQRQTIDRGLPAQTPARNLAKSP